MADNSPTDGQNGYQIKNLQRNVEHVLVTSGQNISTGCLTAVVSDTKYIGVGWMPVPGITFDQARAMAVFLNSTAGRLQLMQNPGKSLNYPKYNPGTYENIRIPNLADEVAVSVMSKCWDLTRDMDVPQFRDGECTVRRLWDEAVAEALGWELDRLSELRGLLHDEPHVRGLGREQYGD